MVDKFLKSLLKYTNILSRIPCQDKLLKQISLMLHQKHDLQKYLNNFSKGLVRNHKLQLNVYKQ